MNKTHKLTVLQQQYAEEHMGIVYAFLRHKNLSVDDYYDIVIFGYLSAVQDFDENPELSRYSFTTIAWRRMNSCLCDHYTYENRQKRRAVTVSIHSGTENGLTLDEILPERRKELQEQTADRMLLLEVLSCLTETEKQMVLLRRPYLPRDRGAVFPVCQRHLQPVPPYAGPPCHDNRNKHLLHHKYGGIKDDLRNV